MVGRRILSFFCIATAVALVASCSAPLPWPESPLYTFPETDPEWQQPDSLAAAMELQRHAIWFGFGVALGISYGAMMLIRLMVYWIANDSLAITGGLVAALLTLVVVFVYLKSKREFRDIDIDPDHQQQRGHEPAHGTYREGSIP